MKSKIKLFISYASEDRESIARPLAQALRANFDIWYDEFSLVMGDSLRSKIDEGLISCDFGIVILSKNFFQKNWPQRELNALVSRESSGRKAILPIWHNITRTEVENYSPLLADRVGILSTLTTNNIIQEIERAIQVEGMRVSYVQGISQITRDKRNGIIENVILPSGESALYSQLLNRDVPRPVLDMLTDVRQIESTGNRPGHGGLTSVMQARYPDLGENEIDDAQHMIIQFLVNYSLVSISHDSLGYPYWHTTDKGKTVLKEILSKFEEESK